VNTASPPHPLAQLTISQWGDQLNGWITNSKFDVSTHSCPIATGNSLITVSQCQFVAGAQLYANYFKLSSTSASCISPSTSVTVDWTVPNVPVALSPVALFNSAAYVQFSVSPLSQDDLLVLSLSPAYPSDQIASVLYKGALLSNNTPCSPSCVSSSFELSLGMFGVDQPVAETAGLHVFDACFHCGGAYDTFYAVLQSTSLTSHVTVTPTLTKISPLSISSGQSVSQSIGSGNSAGIFTFKVVGTDWTVSSNVNINVNSGAVSVALFQKSGTPFDSSAGCTNGYGPIRYKWCVAGVPCRVLYSQIGNYPFTYDDDPTTFYGVVIGTANVTVSFDSLTCNSNSLSSSSAPFCSGQSLPSFVSSGPVSSQDLYAQQVYNKMYQAVQALNVKVSSSCSNALRAFACQLSFPQCSNGVSVGNGISYNTCNNIVSACGQDMQFFNLPEYSCSRTAYTGKNNNNVLSGSQRVSGILSVLVLMLAVMFGLM